jgi:hypothetical protein
MALVKEPPLPRNARESVEQAAFPSSRADGIHADDPENWATNDPECVREAARYEKGRVPGVNVYTGRKGR